MVTISLHKVDFEKAFKFNGGIAAYSISELADILEKLPHEEFTNFVNDNKNDFANWIEFVFNEKDLAQDLRKIKSQPNTITLLDDFLHQKIKKVQEIKEKHNKEIPKTKKEFHEVLKEVANKSKETLFEKKKEEKNPEPNKQEELKKKLDDLQKELDKKLKEKSKEYQKEKTTESNDEESILHKYILVWLIVSFIIGLIIGIILSKLFLF
ncbi:hypothetical protein JXM83_05510 [Candidatus Woesearchaeota archaeon]|nr:hypothetical protein [Candidatus Woesearchaeota archaeon]